MYTSPVLIDEASYCMYGRLPKVGIFVFCFSVVLSVPGSRIPGESQWDNLRKIKGPLTINSHYASWSLAEPI